jgi:cytochrome P450
MVPWVDKLPLKSNKKYLDALEEFDGFIYDVIEARINEIKKNSYNGRDLLTSMLKLTEQEADIKQLRDELASIFAAGHDSKFKIVRCSTYILD